MISDNVTDPAAEQDDAPLVRPAKAKAEAIKRLLIGFSGLCTMLLLVGLANIIRDQAQETDKTTVPEAAPTVAAKELSNNKDPLTDAGVLPELPAATGAPAAVEPPATNASAAQP